VLIKYALEFLRNLKDGLIPGYPFKSIPDAFKRKGKPISVMLVKCDIKAFSTGVPLAPGVFFVRTNLYNPVIFHLDFQTAINGTQGTARFFP
jgi:hypothetical protein